MSTFYCFYIHGGQVAMLRSPDTLHTNILLLNRKLRIVEKVFATTLYWFL